VNRFDVCCYPIPNKPKALLLCEAFAAGVRAVGGKARVCTNIPARLEPGAAMFYGVRPAVKHLWEQAKAGRHHIFYADNSYFDCAREKQFRITKNAIQHRGIGESDGTRFAALGIEVKPMRPEGIGDHVVVALQSEEFMRVVAGDPGWRDRVITGLGDVPLIVRTKQTKRPLRDDLQNAKGLVTWSSAAAVTALLEGVRVACSTQCCATYADDRLKWAQVLSDNQWTADEIARGDAWRTLSA
jgi:hypothetical protein